MTLKFSRFPTKSLAAALTLGAVVLASGESALAQQSCQEDFQRFSQRRMAQMSALSGIAKRGKGKMDPIAACPAARALVATEASMLAYMTKNKEWCVISDEVINGFRATHAKTVSFGAQACEVAAKARKMQEMQRQQAATAAAAAPKLPAGPL